jgi:hypothetical protein
LTWSGLVRSPSFPDDSDIIHINIVAVIISSFCTTLWDFNSVIYDRSIGDNSICCLFHSTFITNDMSKYAAGFNQENKEYNGESKIEYHWRGYCLPDSVT